MNIKKEKEIFIKEYPEYKADIEHFFRFVETQTNSIDYWFCGVETVNVLNCLEDLCLRKIIRTKSKARNFVNALAKFFNFLLAKNLQNNKLREALKGGFNATEKRVPYHEELSSYILNNSELKDEKNFSPIDTDEIALLIAHCDKLIKMRIFYEKGSEPKIFGQMSGALCIKLILFSGISYNTARLLEFSDLNAEIGVVEINSIRIMLPPKLSHQFREYSRIYTEKGLKVNGSKLFVGKNGEPWGDSTTDSGVIAVLRAAIKKSSISEINRYAIRQHITNGLPERMILQLTGEKNEVLRKCYEEIQDQDAELFSFVNSILVRNPVFGEL